MFSCLAGDHLYTIHPVTIISRWLKLRHFLFPKGLAAFALGLLSCNADVTKHMVVQLLKILPLPPSFIPVFEEARDRNLKMPGIFDCLPDRG